MHRATSHHYVTPPVPSRRYTPATRPKPGCTAIEKHSVSIYAYTDSLPSSERCSASPAAEPGVVMTNRAGARMPRHPAMTIAWKS
jgi:hypothetical protein